jgi:hypothetical protein
MFLIHYYYSNQLNMIILHVFLTCNAALSFEQVIEDETSYVSLLRRKPLKVNVDFKLDVLTDRVDPVRRLVFAQKIFLTSLEEPRKQIDDKL